MVSWKFIFVLVFSSSYVVNSSNHLHKIVRGNLSNSWIFNVTIFARDLKGIVLYSVDSEQNKLSIRISMGLNKKFIRLSFNNAFIRSPLRPICGCDPCDNTIMNFYIQLKNDTISVLCNKFGQDSLIKSEIKDNIPDSILNTIKNKTNGLFVGMGNVDNTDHLIGCLKSLSFNKSKIKFKESGSEFLPVCAINCTDTMCNKGKCGVSYPIGPLCDCSNTALNGRYCNRTMKEYSHTDRLSYRRKTILNQVQVKLSWKLSGNKTYCLMELIYESGHVTISVNEDNVLKEVPMKDLEVLSRISSEEINFITANLTDSHLLVKILDKVILIQLPLMNKFKINIGYTENKAQCEPFVGKYDLNFNTTQLQQVPPTIEQLKKMNVLWILLPLLLIILVIVGVASTMYIFCVKKNKECATGNDTLKLDTDENEKVPVDEDVNELTKLDTKKDIKLPCDENESDLAKLNANKENNTPGEDSGKL